MTAKEYLKQIWWVDREINEKMSELEYLQTKAEGLGGSGSQGAQSKGNTKDKISAIVIKIVDLQTYINMQTDKLIDLRTKITKQICKMRDQKSRVILSCRYIRHMKWEQIEKELHYEQRTLMRIHRNALKEFEAMYPQIRKLK